MTLVLVKFSLIDIATVLCVDIESLSIDAATSLDFRFYGRKNALAQRIYQTQLTQSDNETNASFAYKGRDTLSDGKCRDKASFFQTRETSDTSS